MCKFHHQADAQCFGIYYKQLLNVQAIYSWSTAGRYKICQCADCIWQLPYML